MNLLIKMEIDNDYLQGTGAPVVEVARLVRELADKLEEVGRLYAAEVALSQPQILFHNEEKGKHRIARAEVSVHNVVTI